MTKRIIALALAVVMLLAVSATALAATSIPPPFQCSCGNRNLTKIRTMWNTSNPPQIVWELWQCGNGHRFYNYPPIGV